MPKTNPRSAARLSASQSYYSMLIDKGQNKTSALNAAFDILSKENVKVKQKFSEELLSFSLDEKEAIDASIQKYMDKSKSVDKMNPLLLAILSIAIAELTLDKETDRPILINEYLKITSEFFGSQETGFVNAVLDKFVKDNPK
jgi:transcription antitermination factor NusB